MDMAHAVEIYNHGCALETDRGDGFHVLDALLNEGRRLTGFATDDAHFHIDDSCGGWVNVKAEALDPDALVAALKAGDYYSSEGPEIRALAIDGEEVVVECSPVRCVSIVGRGQRNLQANGADRTRARLPIGKFEGDWLRVVVMDDSGKRAWSNPIWV